MSDAHNRESPGILLRRQRLALGLTQEALAERSGVAKRTIQDLERDAARPRRETLRRLIDALAPAPEARAALEAVGPSPRLRVVAPTSRGPRVEPVRIDAGARRHHGNLPVPRTRLIGREQEVAAIRQLLLRDDPSASPSRAGILSPTAASLRETAAATTSSAGRCSRGRAPTSGHARLVTLTGPAGTGKTHLGLQVAAELLDRFPDGAHFVGLAPIADPALVPATIAQALEIPDLGGRPVLDSLKEYLRTRRLLLVLDNFEHVLPAATVVSELLGASPGLTVLATSRAPLGLRGEHERPVPPLALPDRQHPPAADALSRFAAVALFVERAAAITPDFVLTDDNGPAVAEICHRLDGLPLAIELAAARVRLLSPQAMLARLERRLPLLTGGARDLPARQQTLRGAIAWSHDLLDDDERRLFRRLAVFVGGCTLDAVDEVARAAGVGGPMVGMMEGRGTSHLPSPLAPPPSSLDLVEALVARSLVRREDEPGGGVRLGMLETIREYAAEQLDASGERAAMMDRHLAYYLTFAEAARDQLQRPDGAAWFDRLERENDNFRAALEWSAAEGSPGGPARADVMPGTSRVEAGTRLAAALGFFWILRGRGRENLPRVMALAALTPPGTAVRARILASAAQILGPMLGRHREALSLADEALSIWRALGDAHGIAIALLRRGQVAQGMGDSQRSLALLAESRALFRELGGESGPEWPMVLLLADVTQGQGDLDRAEPLYDEALAEARTRGDIHAVAHGLRNWGRIRRLRGDAERAFTMLRESVLLLVPFKDVRCAYTCLEDFAAALCEHDRPADVARLFGAAEAVRELIGRPLDGGLLVHHDRAVASVRRRLAPEAFAAAWAEGRAMTMDQALAYALERPAPA